MNNRGSIFDYSLFYIIIIPIGVVVLLFLGDKLFRCYEQAKFEKDSIKVLTECMDAPNIDTIEDMKKYISDRYVYYEYNLDDIKFTIIDMEDYFYFDASKLYNSVISEFMFSLKKGYNEVFKGRTLDKNTYMSVGVMLKTYYDDNKKTVIEEYNPDLDDIILEDDLETENI